MKTKSPPLNERTAQLLSGELSSAYTEVLSITNT